MRHHSYQLPSAIFDSIDTKWHQDIFRFIDSGDASQEFLDFLDSNIECQNVIEIAFTLVTQDVAATVRQLGESRTINPSDSDDSMTTTYARLLTHFLLTLSDLDAAQFDEVCHRVGAWLPPDRSQAVVARFVQGITTSGACVVC